MNIVRMQNRLVRFRSGRDRPGASAVRCNPSFSSRFAVLRSGHLLVDRPVEPISRLLTILRGICT
jgi:hypothetical protein